MISTINAPLFTLAVGAFIGISCLVLIANELGKRANLSVPARFLLSGALGFGVLSVGIKVGIVSMMSLTNSHAMAAAGAAAREAMTGWDPGAEAIPGVEAVSAEPASLRTWRALPAAPPEPRDNRSTPAKIALGRLLFNDVNLSLDRTLSCASCHALSEGGDDNLRYSVGYQKQTGDRNAPTVLNAAYLTRLFWDGRASSLERQAEGPFLNPVEMAMPSTVEVEARVKENPFYVSGFAEVFPGSSSITIRNITRAIAAYERTLVTPNTPYDLFIRGEDTALSASALRGMALFDEVGCRNCHMDPVFSAAGSEKPMGVYRRFPVYQEDNPYLEDYDLLVEGSPTRFRVPSLRNVALTAPYFHNGSVADLKEAIRIMAVSQLGRTISNDPLSDVKIVSRQVVGETPGRNIALLDNRALSELEVDDIAAFLRSLSAAPLPR